MRDGTFTALWVAVLAAAAAVIGSSGCAVESTRTDAQVLSDTVGAWEAEHGPLAARCMAELDKMQIVDLPSDSTKCEFGGQSHEGCYFTGEPVLYLKPGTNLASEREWLIEHEATHWLLDCSGLGSDPDHQHPTAW